MSFDTTFDFTPLVDNTQNTIVNLTTSLSLLTQQQSQLQLIQGYSVRVTKALNDVATNIGGINTQLSALNNFLITIDEIKSLDDQSKNILYQFFAFTSLNAETFTSILTRNYQQMLLDSDIVSLIADDVNTNPLKIIVGKLIMLSYV